MIQRTIEVVQIGGVWAIRDHLGLISFPYRTKHAAEKAAGKGAESA